jgi:hypothetical protein
MSPCAKRTAKKSEGKHMSQIFNIYCDESCHLQHDHQDFMVLGALWCPADKAAEIAARVREIKSSHGLATGFEIKWTKVSPAKQSFYMDVLNYFFDDDDLCFRALIADKRSLNHDAFPGQDHHSWYYKMLFTLLSPLLSPDSRYRIYLDLKDTQSAARANNLRKVLCNDRYDFDRHLIQWIQPVRSNEVQQLQLCDLLLGAIAYVNRGLSSNPAKVALVDRIKHRTHYSLVRSTLLRERKLNLFRWQAQQVAE